MATISHQYKVSFEPAALPIARVIKRDIHIIDEDTGYIYLSNLDNTIVDGDTCAKHTIFTCDRIEDLFARFIERNEYKIVRIDDRILHIIFESHVDIVGHVIFDHFEVECALKTVRDEDQRIRLLEREVEQLRAQLRTMDNLACDVAMQKALMDFNMKWGPIPTELDQFARTIVAAELNGTPYIFECVGPGRINDIKFRTRARDPDECRMEINGVTYLGENLFEDTCCFNPCLYDFPWLRSIVRIIIPQSKTWINIASIKCSRIVIDDTWGSISSDPLVLCCANKEGRLNVGPMNHLPKCIRDIIFCLGEPSLPRVPKLEARSKEILLRLAEAAKTRHVLLPEIARDFVRKHRIMDNADFTDTIDRAIDYPTTYEISKILAAQISAAHENTKDLVIPTFDEGAQWSENLCRELI